MSECFSFDTPLHEAIHQLCFNKGVFHRLAPVPNWLAEGMACSFEGSGTSSRGNPRKLNAEYAATLMHRYTARPMTPRERQSNEKWNSIVTDDSRFYQPDAGSTAYIDSWSLHWILVSRHREQFAEYIRSMQALQPLGESEVDARMQHFRETFGGTPSTFWKQFVQDFSSKAPRDRAVKKAMELNGVYRVESHLAALSVLAAVDARGIRADGELKNISPFREMAYYVCILTDTNQKIEWFLPAVRMGKVSKLVSSRAPGRGATYSVFVRSAPADSPTAAAWAAGQVPKVRRRTN